MWFYIFIINLVLGILGIEYAFMSLKRYLDGNEERDSAY